MKFNLSKKAFKLPTPNKIRVFATAWLAACSWAFGYLSDGRYQILGQLFFITGFIAKLISEGFHEEMDK